MDNSCATGAGRAPDLAFHLRARPRARCGPCAHPVPTRTLPSSPRWVTRDALFRGWTPPPPPDVGVARGSFAAREMLPRWRSIPAEVPPELQGRVFAIRQVSAMAASPIAFLLAGVLADLFFEPLMEDPPALLDSLVGSGPGRGIGLMFVLTGIFTVVTVVTAINHPRIENLETEIPDLEVTAVEA